MRGLTDLHMRCGRAALRYVGQGDGEGYASVVFCDVAGSDADGGAVNDVGDVCRGCRTGNAGGFEVATGDGRDRGGYCHGIGKDVSTVGVDGERAVAGSIECDRARTLFTGDLHRGGSGCARLWRVRQGHIEGEYTTAVFCNVGCCDAGPGDVAVVHHIGAEAGARETEARNVAVDHGIHTGNDGRYRRSSLHIVLIRTACHGQVAVQGAAGDGHCLRNTTHRDVEFQVTLRRVINTEAEGDGIALDNIAGKQIALRIDMTDRDGGSFKRHPTIDRCACRIAGGIGGCYGGMNIFVGHQVACQDILAVDQCSFRAGHHACGVGIAMNRERHGVSHLGVAADRAGDGGIGLAVLGSVDDVVASDGVDGDAGGNVDVNGDGGIGGCRGAGRSGHVGGGDAGFDGVVGDQVAGIDVHAVDQRAAFTGRDRRRVGVAVDQQGDNVSDLDVTAHGAGNRGGGLGRLGDVDDVVAGNGADGDVGSDVGRNQWQRLQVGCRGRCRKTVVVGQGVYTLGDAQQLHKSAAAIGAATCAQTGRRGVQGLVQIRATFERLDDGIGCGRSGNGAVLRRGTLVGLDHMVVQTHTLGRRHGQQAAVFHQEFDPDIAHGTNGFAL